MNWTPEGSAAEHDLWIEAWRAFRAAPNPYHKGVMMDAYHRFYRRLTGSCVGLEEILVAMEKNADRIIEEARG